MAIKHIYCHIASKMDIVWAYGFLKPFSVYHFGGSDAAYGAPGSGGSLGFTSPILLPRLAMPTL